MQKKENLNELALFAGAGGGILGGKLLGWRTICAVEWEPYPASVLVTRQNDGLLPPFPIWDDVQTFDGRPWRGIVDVVSGGFPCQDISAAGKGAGIDGERSGMWGHMARIIGEVRPSFVFVENSPMLVTRGLERVLGDLTALGYDTKWTVMGAADVGANHKRDRIWIKAHLPNSDSINHAMRGNSQNYAERLARGYEPRGSISNSRSGCQESARESSDMGQSKRKGLEGQRIDSGQKKVPQSWHTSALAHTQNQGDVWRQWCMGFAEQEHNSGGGSTNGSREWWAVEPNVDRVAHGLAARVDRLKAIGNGQVPLCAATAWRMLR